MVNAIEACHKVDEVAELRNQARAMEVYAKQAMNLDAERKATQVRLRAERRAGELLKEMRRDPASKGGDQRSGGHRVRPKSAYANAIKGAGIDDDALWIWGRFRDVERMKLVERPAPEL